MSNPGPEKNDTLGENIASADSEKRQAVPWPYSPSVYVLRVLWRIVWYTVWPLCWARFPALRCWILRLFGAKVGKATFYASADIMMPWDLEVGDHTTIGPRVRLYNLGHMTIGRHVLISQDAYICGGTHDYTDPKLPLLRLPVVIEDHVWIAAGAFIHPNLTVGQGALVGARAVVTRNVEPWTIVTGNPAKFVKKREMRSCGPDGPPSNAADSPSEVRRS